MRRRDLLRGAGALSAGALAGCIGGGGADTPTPEPDEVLVGPNNSNAFAPAERTVSTGTTVTWTFESPRHNVACDPEADFGSLPDGAEPFTSYAEGDSYDTVAVGETYEHTFSVPGTYEYVCVPHVASGMVGTIVVEEE